MSDKKDSNQTQDLDNTNNNSSIDKSRRKFAKAGIAGLPVIMTVANRPVWASFECTASGMQSGNLSAHPELVDCIAACSHGYYRHAKHACNWSMNYPPNMKWKDMYAGMGYSNTVKNVFGNLRLSDIINDASNASNGFRQLGFQGVAAIQNIETLGTVYGSLSTATGLLNAMADAIDSGDAAAGTLAAALDLINDHENNSNVYCPHGNC